MNNPTELPDLDRGYLKRKLAMIVRDLSCYTAQEMARELVRLAKVADETEVVKEARRAQPEGMSIALREVTDKLSAAAAENLSLNLANIDLRDQMARLTGKPEGEAPQATRSAILEEAIAACRKEKSVEDCILHLMVLQGATPAAQPEGEAPQAVAQTLANPRLPQQLRNMASGSTGASAQLMREAASAIELLTAPAAQHAESGAPCKTCGGDGEHYQGPSRYTDCDDCDGTGRISGSELCARCNQSGVLPALAAQSQGAPRDEDAEFEKWAISEQLAYQDTHHGVVFFNGSGKQLARQAWKARAALAAKAEAPADDLRKLTKERDGWKEEAEHQKALYERACRQIELLKEHERGHIWMWQGDGSDNLSSMSNGMAVLIRADQLRAQQAAAPGVLPDLLPPLGIHNDRDMLNYLMVAFDNEIGTCERCGHSEPTKHMDSAGFLRDYLAAAPSTPGTPEAPKGGA